MLRTDRWDTDMVFLQCESVGELTGDRIEKKPEKRISVFWKIFIIVFCALTFYFRLGYNSDRRLNDYLVVNDLGHKPCLNYVLQIKISSNCFVIFEQNCIHNYDS